HALAGLRIGFAYGHPDLIEGLERVKGSFNSYPIDVIAERVAVEALADEAYFTECRDRIVSTRDRSAARLGDLGFVVLPSRANFLFIRHPKVAARQLFDSLRAGGILVRHFAQPRVEDYLRVTIGTDDEMEALVSTLEPLLPRA
ncbi:MAG: aminotransferase class I/II-fold pyridoxal phosphate-dependent enzyme, partial [bacterium]|nr:aminotransferase class I/II-fold pyridoxal phosphate-dependent enzyme [bacterium]